jgi:hypothetical protein
MVISGSRASPLARGSVGGCSPGKSFKLLSGAVDSEPLSSAGDSVGLSICCRREMASKWLDRRALAACGCS